MPSSICSLDGFVTQRAQACEEWCRHPLLNTSRTTILCSWCSCGCSATAGAGLTAPVEVADFDVAVAAISNAAVAGVLPPLSSLLKVMDAVSHNAESALLKQGKSKHAVLAFFGKYGNIGTEPAQLLAYVRALVCLDTPPSHVCEVGLFQGHSAALFLALTAHQAATYVSIDPHEFGFSPAVLEFLSMRFPGRTVFIRGFSGIQLNATKNPSLSRCNVWSLDGDHQPSAAASDGRSALRASPHVDVILMDDVTDSETTIQRKAGPHFGCAVALNAWEAVKESAGSAFSTSNCSLAGRKYGTPAWCSAWCIGLTRVPGSGSGEAAAGDDKAQVAAHRGRREGSEWGRFSELQVVRPTSNTAVFSICYNHFWLCRLTMPRWSRYAAFHGVDHVVIRGTSNASEVTAGSRSSSLWDKFAAATVLFEMGYEWVLWVDADTAVIRWEHSISSWTQLGNTDLRGTHGFPAGHEERAAGAATELLVSRDRGHPGFYGPPIGPLNAGIFLLKNGELARSLCGWQRNCSEGISCSARERNGFNNDQMSLNRWLGVHVLSSRGQFHRRVTLVRYCFGPRKFQCELNGAHRTAGALLTEAFRPNSTVSSWDQEVANAVLHLNASNLWLLHTIALVETQAELERLQRQREAHPDGTAAAVPSMKTFIAKAYELLDRLLPIPDPPRT